MDIVVYQSVEEQEYQAWAAKYRAELLREAEIEIRFRRGRRRVWGYRQFHPTSEASVEIDYANWVLSALEFARRLEADYQEQFLIGGGDVTRIVQGRNHYRKFVKWAISELERLGISEHSEEKIV